MPTVRPSVPGTGSEAGHAAAGPNVPHSQRRSPGIAEEPTTEYALPTPLVRALKGRHSHAVYPAILVILLFCPILVFRVYLNIF